jgi:hypothetical protein
MRRGSAFLLLALTALGTQAATAQPVPLGPEVRVDTVPGKQYPGCPKIGIASSGSFEIAWDYGGSFPAIIAGRLFDAAGTALSPSQLKIGSFGYYPVADDVVAAGEGFDVLWHQVNDLRPESPVFYRRHLNPQGVPPRAPVRLGRGSVKVVWPWQGNIYLGAWVSNGTHALQAQRLDAAGNLTGPIIRLNSRPAYFSNVALTRLAGGGFVAVWVGRTVAPGTGRQIVRARMFSPSGAPLGNDFDVNTLPGGPGGAAPFLGPDLLVVPDLDGGFVAAWSYIQAGERIYYRRYHADGTAPPHEIQAAAADGLIAPVSGAFDSEGRFLLLWVRLLPGTRWDLGLRLFDEDGPLRPEAPLSSEASGSFDEPFCGDVARQEDGTWLVAWAAQTRDSQPSAVFVRRYGEP